MSKLINTPKECGYRKPLHTRLGIFFGYICTHPLGESCQKNNEFPTYCPLEEALPKKSIHWP